MYQPPTALYLIKEVNLFLEQPRHVSAVMHLEFIYRPPDVCGPALTGVYFTCSDILRLTALLGEISIGLGYDRLHK